MLVDLNFYSFDLQHTVPELILLKLKQTIMDGLKAKLLILLQPHIPNMPYLSYYLSSVIPHNNSAILTPM